MGWIKGIDNTMRLKWDNGLKSKQDGYLVFFGDASGLPKDVQWKGNQLCKRLEIFLFLPDCRNPLPCYESEVWTDASAVILFDLQYNSTMGQRAELKLSYIFLSPLPISFIVYKTGLTVVWAHSNCAIVPGSKSL